uniref:DNA replication licensing factor MCM2 n=1 Tax=Solanum chacoense TaxID=4108 RepID=A0A0V0IWQ4_SOLCH
MEEVANKVVFDLHPNYKQIHQKVYVRITNLPVYDQIRNIRQIHLNTMIRIGGVVTRRSGVFPQLQQVKYDCNKCGAVLGPFFQNSYSEVKVGSCPECQSKGPFSVNVEQTIYRNYQKLTLQESPGIVPAGRLPRYKEVILLNDLIDCARPGEEIEVTGIYTNNFDLSLNTKNGFPVFSTVIEANYVTKKQDLFSAYKLTQEDKEEIEKLAKDPRIGERIFKSIAPSIYGHEDIKTAIALAMFGGQEKNVEGKHRLRGDINILLLGDPGTAKSQFLKYVEKTGQRAVYTTGKGASAVGLTAAVHKDPVTREWTLEGGALVLADRGICLIDEFDKMNDQDRVSIHEAMEQQTISITKAGIQATLNARTSILAAANPTGGRYDKTKPLKYNVALPPAILSRFDLVYVMIDDPDDQTDYNIAHHIVRVHQRRENPVDPPFSTAQVKRYIMYAKTLKPKLSAEARELLVDSYVALRQDDTAPGSRVAYRMTVRQLEALIRLSEAIARCHLDIQVQPRHVQIAKKLLKTSIISVESSEIDLSEFQNENPEDGVGDTQNGTGQEETEPTEAPAESVSGNAENGAGTTSKQGKKLVITDEYFQRVTRALILRLRQHEETVLQDGTGLAGMRQKDLIQWYVSQQNDKNSYSSMEEAAAEVTKVKAIIESLIRREGHLIVVDDGTQAGEESGRQSASRNDRILAVAPNYVVD